MKAIGVAILIISISFLGLFVLTDIDICYEDKALTYESVLIAESAESTPNKTFMSTAVATTAIKNLLIDYETIKIYVSTKNAVINEIEKADITEGYILFQATTGTQIEYRAYHNDKLILKLTQNIIVKENNYDK